MHLQRTLFTTAAPKQPLVVAYGMGVDSTAMLIGLAQRGVRPDLILFADTGRGKTGDVSLCSGLPPVAPPRRFSAV